MLRFQENMHGWGFTGAMCLVPHFVDNDAYLAFYESGQLALRLNLAGGQYEPGWDFDEIIGGAARWRESLSGNELLKVSSIKFFADGVVEGMTAYLSEPYDDAAGLEPGFRSDFNWDVEELKDITARTVAEGFQLYIHTIGDAATSEMMNILEYIKAQNPNTDHRTVFAHLQLVSDNDKARMGRMGVIGNTQPFWHIRAPGWFDEVELILLGEKRAMTMYPVRSLIDAGVTVTFSGDHPVTANNNPFWAIEAAVTRNLYTGEFGVPDITDIDDPTWLLNPAERVSVKQAIEAYTINGAYQLFRENEIGSITIGKRADFIVVDLDILNINPLDISETQVNMTFFNGKRVR
ncbi:MAG: amidohydrolase family protein, partial [Oscillospiraceae bacterium]|nr:amidohydrolase family protein [Oscillospiraceae bacterium]